MGKKSVFSNYERLSDSERMAWEEERLLNNEEMEKEYLHILEEESADNSDIHVSDRIDIKKLVERVGNKIFLIAGVGAGKSTWVKEVLPQEGSVLFITSRRAKVDEDELDSDFVNRINENDILRKYLTVVTNAKITKALERWSEQEGSLEKFVKRYDYIVVDEVHSIATDSTFTDSSFGIKTFIEYAVELGKTVIAMTGTPEPVEKYFRTNNWSRIDLRKLCAYVKPFKIDTIAKNKVISLIKKELDEEKKVVYFVNNTDTIKDVFEELLKKRIIEENELAVVVAEDTYGKVEEKGLKKILGDYKNFFKFCQVTYKSIIEKKELPDACKVLLSTSKLREGIDIMTPNVTIICDNHILSNIIQFCGRVRVGGGYVYIVKDSSPHNIEHDELLYRYAEKNEIDSANAFLRGEVYTEDNMQKVSQRNHLIKHVERNPYIHFNYIQKEFQIDSLKFEEEMRQLENMKNWTDKLQDYCSEYRIVNTFMTAKQKEEMLIDICKNAVDKEIKIFGRENQQKFARIVCEIADVPTKVQKSKISKIFEKYGYILDSDAETKKENRDKTYWYIFKAPQK